MLSVNYVYMIPIFKQSHGALGYALKGWELSGILTTYSGAPVNIVTSATDPAGLGFLFPGSQATGQNRPDMICNPNAGAPHGYSGAAQSTAQHLAWFNTGCFAAVPQGEVRPGNEGVNSVIGPGFFNLDASLMKNFRIRERFTTQFRLETLNTLNWVNPAGFASLNMTATNFGQINNVRAPRRMQLALKLMF